MIIHEVRQRSDEWDQLRLGIPTSSQIHKILTPTGKLSSQADGYLDYLLTSWAWGHPIDEEPEFRSQFMERGEHLEPQARAAYEFQANLDVQIVGFVTTDNGLAGCSPDGLVGDDGGLEIKSPSPTTHTGYIRTQAYEKTYTPQIQMCMMICEREWWDILSFCPGHPIKDLVITRAHRDEKYITSLRSALDEFLVRLLEARQSLWQSSPALRQRHSELEVAAKKATE